MDLALSRPHRKAWPGTGLPRTPRRTSAPRTAWNDAALLPEKELAIHRSCDIVFYIAMLQLIVHPSDELPIYRQIMRQIVETIAGGRLEHGDKLTSHRELAEQLVVAPLTVKKAYDELELLGYVETQRGRGTFVCAHPPKLNPAEQRDRLRATARKLLSEAYVGGLRFKDMEEILREADREISIGHASPAGDVRRDQEES